MCDAFLVYSVLRRLREREHFDSHPEILTDQTIRYWRPSDNISSIRVEEPSFGRSPTVQRYRTTGINRAKSFCYDSSFDRALGSLSMSRLPTNLGLSVTNDPAAAFKWRRAKPEGESFVLSMIVYVRCIMSINLRWQLAVSRYLYLSSM